MEVEQLLNYNANTLWVPPPKPTTEVLFARVLLEITPHCAICQTQETPQWRRGWYSSWLEKYVNLCNTCGLRYRKKHHSQLSPIKKRNIVCHCVYCDRERYRYWEAC